MPETLTVVTPWFPSPNKPMQGSFVESQVRAVQPLTGRLDVLATEDWIAPRGPFVRRAQRRHYRDVTASAVRPVLRDGYWLTRLASGTPRARRPPASTPPGSPATPNWPASSASCGG